MPEERVVLAERYVLVTPIARGGMGTVWNAKDEVLARPVAVKVLNHDLADDEDFVARFRREALAAARLSHPHIVAIYDTGSETGPDGTSRYFIVMEHCGGGTLEKSSRMDHERIADIGVDICSALGHAHRHEIIHRDVKPANILFTPEGSLKVGDFGIAKAAFSANEITTTGVILGTVTYISPEQANGEEPDARSDLYSLGVVLFELLTGRPPFEADSQIAVAMKHIREDPPDPRSIRAGISKDLSAVIMKSLAKDRNDRFDSAEEFADALRSPRRGDTAVMRRSAIPSRADTPPSSPATGGPKPARKDRSEYRWLIPLLLVAAVATALALVLPRVLDSTDEPGGGGGGDGSSGTTRVEVSAPTDFDPDGGDGEHPDETGLAIDGDLNTVWPTSNYNDKLSLTKSGVGLLFDLGEATEISGLEVTGDTGSFEIRAGDSAPTAADDLEVVDSADQASGTTEFSFDPVTARYWLVWIIDLPGGGGGRATIAEVRFLGP